jgi:hypothetical protein
MLYGTAPEGVTVGEDSRWALAPLLINVAVLTVLGLFLPAPLLALLNRIVGIVSK